MEDGILCGHIRIYNLRDVIGLFERFGCPEQKRNFQLLNWSFIDGQTVHVKAVFSQGLSMI